MCNAIAAPNQPPNHLPTTKTALGLARRIWRPLGVQSQTSNRTPTDRQRSSAVFLLSVSFYLELYGFVPVYSPGHFYKFLRGRS